MVGASNIEARARALCEANLRAGRVFAEEDMPAAVDRFWHTVAAEIEAGLIDQQGRYVPHDLETGLEAYREWRVRHPHYVISDAILNQRP